MIKILIAENAIAAHIFKSILQPLGFTDIDEANDGLFAVSQFKQRSHDLVFIAYDLPGMDGICALREMKKFCPEAKVVMFFELGQESKIMEAVMSGAFDYIVKPFAFDSLAFAVKGILA